MNTQQQLRTLTPQELIQILQQAAAKYPKDEQFAARTLYIRQLREEAQKK